MHISTISPVDPQSPKPAEGSTQRSQLFTLPWIYSPHPRREKLVRLESNNFKSPSKQLLHKYWFLWWGKNDHATGQNLTWSFEPETRDHKIPTIQSENLRTRYFCDCQKFNFFFLLAQKICSLSGEENRKRFFFTAINCSKSVLPHESLKQTQISIDPNHFLQPGILLQLPKNFVAFKYQAVVTVHSEVNQQFNSDTKI